MLTTIEKLQKAGFGERVFIDKDLGLLFGGSPARRYALVNKILSRGEIVRVRRGIYVLAEQYRTVNLNPFFLANRTVSGSYVSFESALEYHGWITKKEPTVVVTSVIYSGRTRDFHTHLGEFKYVFLPVNDLEFLSGVSRQTVEGQPYMIAKPLRALADYVYNRKIKWTGIDFLLQKLHLEEGELLALTQEDFQEVLPIFRSKRVLSFLQNLQTEIIPKTPTKKIGKAGDDKSSLLNKLELPTTHPKSSAAEQDVLKDIWPKIIVNGLYEGNFFHEAFFNGGTCLRFIHKIPRFSDGLDFMLKQPDPNFRWQHYQKAIENACKQYGILLKIKDRSELNRRSVQQRFVKEKSIGKLLEMSFKHYPSNKSTLKLEIDINPPAGSLTQMKFLDFPTEFSVDFQDLPSQFAGKCHALLCRKVMKGRDWYDFIWFINQKVVPNLHLLSNAINQHGPWAKQHLQVTPIWYINTLKEKIKTVDWEAAKKEVSPFLEESEKKNLMGWNKDFFDKHLEKLKKLLGR